MRLRLTALYGALFLLCGAALLALERPQEAETAIERGLQLGLGRIHLAYYDRAIAKERLGDIRGAYFDYKMSVDIRPDFELGQQQLMRFRVVQAADANDPSARIVRDVAQIIPPSY